MNLPCMNCKAEVEQGQGKFFAEVFVCSNCETMAVHFFERLVRELNFLLTMAKESIRLALVQGKFSFPEGPAGEPSKRAVLEAILQMEESREKQHNKDRSCPTPSSVATPPSALSKDLPSAEGNGSSHKDSAQG